ncbi:MAG: primosomal protein N' [Phycisphaerales bacterium]|nr:primosomal protein N' [Phycisphaerales bacterium]
MPPPADLFSTPRPTVRGRFARVVLERGIDQPDGLTYAIPSDLADLAPGDRVSAPLGRSDRPARGLVLDLIDHADIEPARLKILTARAPGPRFPPELLRLASWMAGYYCCPIGMVLGAMMPAAVKKNVGRVSRRGVRPSAHSPEDLGVRDLPPSARKAWDLITSLDRGVFPLDARALADRLGLRTTAAIGRLLRAGMLEEVQMTGVRARTAREGWEADIAADRPRELTPDQDRAVRAVSDSLGTFAPLLLYGVTGSGKTEVYLQVLERVLARGQAAIVLVPEISLTPQTAGRFIARFGRDKVAVLHSGLTAAERHREWDRAARAGDPPEQGGGARIVVGARSAVFAPFPEGMLGLVVVDEEHDHSYKQDQLPRYHARDVALRRAQLAGFPVLMGSATPSLESWHNALSATQGGAGRFRLLELTGRVAGGRLPPVYVVDMAEERRRRTEDRRGLHALGPTLEQALAHTLADGEGQAILLLNRRGYASYIMCPDSRCGWLLTCDDCDVTMVYHREGSSGGPGQGHGVVRCHHCLAEKKLPEVCPVCGKRVNTFGFGTQRLEEELGRKFPLLSAGASMLRLDSDSMRSARDYFDALDRFRRGDVRLLLGTQMIAKGLDFPHVRLIGVINADTALALPDFRAAERTFQLVAQVAGRAGRSEASADAARVIVQTFNPAEPSITLAAAHDFPGFAARELAIRAAHGLPPIGRMARLVFRDRQEAKAVAAAGRAAEALAAAPGVRLKGPAPAPFSRIAGHFRVSLELFADSAGPIQRALTDLRNRHMVKSDAHTAVDVDPVQLL